MIIKVTIRDMMKDTEKALLMDEAADSSLVEQWILIKPPTISRASLRLIVV